MPCSSHPRYWLLFGALALTACGGSATKDSMHVQDGGTVDGGSLQATLTADSTDGVMVGDTDTDGTMVTLVLKDGEGRPMSGVRVEMHASEQGASVSEAPVTDADGTTQARLRSTKIGAVVVTAATTIDGVTTTLAPSVTVSFVAGPFDPSGCTETPDKYDAVSDGVDAITFAVAVRDQYRNPASGHAVRLDSTGNWNNLGGSSVTDSDGKATLTFSSTEPGQKDVTILVDEQVALHQFVHFNPAVANADKSSIVTGQSDLFANGSQAFAIGVIALDDGGRPIDGAQVRLTVSGSGNQLTPMAGKTGHDGIFSASLTSTSVESKTIDATIGDVAIAPLTVRFVAGPPDAAHSSISISPFTIGIGYHATVQVVLHDDHDHPIAAAHVTTTVTPSDVATVDNADSYTDMSGLFSTDVVGAKLGNATVHVEAGSLQRDFVIAVQ